MFTAAVIGVLGCGTPAKLPVAAGIGVKPVLPPQESALIPIVNVVTAKGWQSEAMPKPADGLTVRAFARGLDHSTMALRASQRRRARRRDERATATRRRQGNQGIFLQVLSDESGWCCAQRQSHHAAA